jgi:hypothetical protein
MVAAMDNVSRDDSLIGGLALLLVIDLIALPWLSVSTGILGSADLSATSSPDGWLGVLAMLAALAVAADLAIERLSPESRLPEIGGSRATTRLVLVRVAAAFIALKFLFHIHFGNFGFGFYAAVLLVGGLFYVTSRARHVAAIR